MTLYQNILMWVSLAAAFALAAAGVVVWCDMREILPGRRILHAFMRLPWLVRLFLVAFVVQLVVHGSTKTNQTNGVEGGTTNAPTMTGIVLGGARGRAPNGVVQPEAGRVPTGAVLAQNQWRRGCWEDWFAVSFEDGWVFPHGTNHLSHVAVMTQGELRTGVRDTDAVASLGAKVAHVPFDTCFYHELTPSNTYRFVWDRAYIDRNTNAPMYAAIELFRNGDKCVTTNGVAAFTPREIPFPHIGIGQNDDWVRTNFVNAADILSVGYANWVDAQVGYGEDNGLYKLTATVANEPPEAFLLTVGEQSVAIAHAGEYVFLLEKGEEYSIDTWPKGMDVEFSAQDDVDPYGPLLASWWGGWSWSEWTTDGGALHLIYPTFAGEGRIWWLPTFYGSPDIGHVGPDSGAMTFTAVLSDYRYAEAVAYHWTCEDGNVVIASPNSRETTITFVTMPSWREATLTVTATVGTNELCSTLTGFTYGTNDTPQVYFCFSAPDAVLLNSNRTDNAKLRKMSLSLSSDTDRTGQVRLSCTVGSDKIAIWGTSNRTSRISLSQTWSAAAFTNIEAYVEGCATSSALADVRLKAEYVPDDGDAHEITRDLTVVEIGEVSLPGAPDDGLVITRGSSVLLKVDCLPVDAESLVSTIWESRRLRLDLTSHDDWSVAATSSGNNEATYTPANGGIYQVRVKAGVGGGGVDERCFRWASTEPTSTGYKRKGDLKSFGVVSHVWQKTLRDCAQGFLGSTGYLNSVSVPAQYGFPSYGAGDLIFKCNIFVAHRIVQSELTCPKLHGRLFNRYPPTANDWGDPNLAIESWLPVVSGEYPEPGYVIAEPSDDESSSGHVGILDFDDYAINAGRDNVNRKFTPRIEGFLLRKWEER